MGAVDPENGKGVDVSAHIMMMMILRLQTKGCKCGIVENTIQSWRGRVYGWTLRTRTIPWYNVIWPDWNP